MIIVRQFLQTFGSPVEALATAAAKRNAVPALLVATLCSIAFTIVFVRAVDFTAAMAEALDRIPEAAGMTPHDREEALAKAQKAAAVSGYVGAAFGSVLDAALIAGAVWAAFWLLGSAPPFSTTFSVIAWANLPQALEALLSIPAFLSAGPLTPREAGRLLPWAGTYFLGPSVTGPVAALASSLNLFVLWSWALVALGMAKVAGASRKRAALVIAAVWMMQVALRMFGARTFGPTGG